ncbi:MAG: flagellar biosynthesis protein flip [Gemmatimonadetes bacterium]|nr:flagellar biosynthesis protein flip [Gemmatimonadota bacterium]
MSFGASLTVLAALGLVLLLLGVALQFLKRFAPGATGGRGRLAMQVVQRLSLGPKQGIAVVQIGTRYIAVTVGEGGVNRLYQLEESEIAAIESPMVVDSKVPVFRTAFNGALRGFGLPAAGAILLALSLSSGAGAQRTRTPVRPASNVTTSAAPKPANTVEAIAAATAEVLKNKPAATPFTLERPAVAGQAPAAPAPMNNVAARKVAEPAKVVAPTVSADADLAIAKLVPRMDVRVGGDKSEGFRLSGTVGIVVMMGLLTLLPTLLLMMTSFTRILIVLHFLRTALGTQNAPPAHLVAAMALLLTGFVMAPTMAAVNRDAIQPWMEGQIQEGQMLERGAQPFREFMLRQTRDHDLQVFVDLSRGQRPATAAQVPLVTLMSAFVTSELRTAFQIGFALFLPFIIIDVVVSSVLMSMGMFMLPPAMISLPFKLLLFVLVDGWTLIVQSLVASFR